MADGNVFDAKTIVRGIFYFPENLVLPLNMNEASYETPYSLLNINMHVIYMLVFGLLLSIYLLMKCLSKKCHKVLPLQMKFGSLLFWNSLTQYFTSAYLVLTISAFLNLKHLEWKDSLPGVNLSNFLSILVAICVVTLPVLIVATITKKRKEVDTD